MRIGTWNLAGRWTPGHRRFLDKAGCDLWLLTELADAAELGGHLVRSEAMPPTEAKSWAAVSSAEPLGPCRSAHEAAAMVRWRGILVCCCVLPWRGARCAWPDDRPNSAGRTSAALDRLRPVMTRSDVPVIWGGDWNHAMSGREFAGSLAGREALEALTSEAGLVVVTTHMPHANDAGLTIDHVAVPAGWRLGSRRRVVAATERGRLSDHDAYVVEVEPI